MEEKFQAEIHWTRDEESPMSSFSREHTLIFPGKINIQASSAPVYRGDPKLVNPEELFVSSIVSCQMLTYLFLCAKNNLTAIDYKDKAEGVLVRQADGKVMIKTVELRPMITFQHSESQQFRATAIRLIHEAHDDCFIANSIKSQINIEPRFIFV